MTAFVLGIKSYVTDWYIPYSLSYEDTAETLYECGFSSFLPQGRFLRMADDLVISEFAPVLRVGCATYNDLKFLEAQACEGIGCWSTLSNFFNRWSLKEDTSLYSVDCNNNQLWMIAWYIGTIPSCNDVVERPVKALGKVIENRKIKTGWILS